MSETKRIQIALVDDDADEGSFFQIALDYLGVAHDFIFFEKAHDFVAHIENESVVLPDIVFVDMKMPKISGQELIRKIRDNSRFDGMQAIIYTAHISEKEKEVMQSIGSFEFFIKPTEFAQLTEMLRGVIVNS